MLRRSSTQTNVSLNDASISFAVGAKAAAQACLNGSPCHVTCLPNTFSAYCVRGNSLVTIAIAEAVD